MPADPITQGMRRGAAVFGFLKAWKANRKAKRTAGKAPKRPTDEVAEEFNQTEENEPMNWSLLIALAGSFLRHFTPWATAFLAGLGIQVNPDASPWLTLGLAIGVYLVMQAISFVRQWQKNRV